MRASESDSDGGVGLVPLLGRVRCPNCMTEFDPGDIVFVSEHSDLIGDPIAGDDAQRRFRPSRFSIDGGAIDPMGMECHRLACPHCHAEVSRALLFHRCLHIGLVGGPGTGKSYFLASMTRTLRRLLPEFGISLEEPTPDLNLALHEYERTLFMPARSVDHVHLEKTDLAGLSIYQRVEYAGHSQLVARPFQFLMHRRDRPRREAILTSLYDTAGEYFLPGSDRGGIQVTRGLATSSVLMLMFDPLQDRTCLQQLEEADQHQSGSGGVSLAQDAIIHEVIHRISRFSERIGGVPTKRLVIVVMPKADVWFERLVGRPLPPEPATQLQGRMRLDVEMIRRTHRSLRDLLRRTCPEFVSAIRSLGANPVFIPTSAIGRAPERIEKDGVIRNAVRSCDISPKWAAVPLLYALSRSGAGLVATMASDE